MTTEKRKYIRSWILCVFVLLVALICREINENQTLLISTMLGVIQTVIYTGLVAFWGVSVRRRIVQPQIRRLLQYVGALMLFWFSDRGIKYYALNLFDGMENIKRYLWYLYYIPMLLLPIIMLMIAFSIRKSENYRLTKKTVVTLISVSVLLFIAVITNDLHQLVFDFPTDAVFFSDSEYSYGVLYFLCLGWIIGCILASLVIMIKKCRLPKSKKVLWLPLVPMAVCIGYCIAYVTGNVTLFDDITIIDCFLLIAILETAITVGLIPSNIHYAALFRVSDLSAIITDKALNPVYTSHVAVIHEKETMAKAVQKAVENASVTENGIRLSAYSIGGGYSFWEEDVTELYEAIEELADVRAELKEEYIVAREVYQTFRKRQSLVEKNRLYNIMQSETKAKTEALCSLLKKLSETDSQSEKQSLTVELALYFAYLKRRNNLLFLKESSDIIRSDELIFCIRESLDNFRLFGAETNMNIDLHLDMHFRNVIQMYDAFEAALEMALKETRELFVTLNKNGNAAILHMGFVCTADLSSLADVGFIVSDEGDDEWILKYTVKEGGEPV